MHYFERSDQFTAFEGSLGYLRDELTERATSTVTSHVVDQTMLIAMFGRLESFLTVEPFTLDLQLLV